MSFSRELRASAAFALARSSRLNAARIIKPMPARVVLAMSGGVDSSVAAYLLKQQGYDVIGLFMRTGVHGDADGRADHKKGCCSALDAGDARRVADRLDIPFYALAFEAEFERII